jgi:prepilin-type N-terminal cleavage/methylation domain-containing protein
MRPSPKCESGFTLVEMLVVTLIGGIVFTALLSMLDATRNASTRVSQRVDSAQRGRIAMEQITQSLRSQVCIKNEPVLSPLADGQANRLAFYAAMPSTVAGQAKPTAFAPQKRELIYDATTKRITEVIQAGTGTYPNTSFDTVPSTRVVATHIVPTSPGAPIFTYYAFKDDGTVDNAAPLAPPLDEDELESVVRIDIAFVATPSTGPRNTGTQTAFESSVTVRLPTRTDSKNPGSGPACMV